MLNWIAVVFCLIVIDATTFFALWNWFMPLIFSIKPLSFIAAVCLVIFKIGVLPTRLPVDIQANHVKVGEEVAWYAANMLLLMVIGYGCYLMLIAYN